MEPYTYRCDFGHPIYDTYGLLSGSAILHHFVLNNFLAIRDEMYGWHKADKKIAGIKALRETFARIVGSPCTLVAAKNEFEAQAKLWNEDPATRSPYAQAQIEIERRQALINKVRRASDYLLSDDYALRVLSALDL